MQRKIFTLLAFLTVFPLAGCGERKQTEQIKTGADIPFAADFAVDEDSGQKNILIAYFSRTGNTDFPEGIDALTSAKR